MLIVNENLPKLFGVEHLVYLAIVVVLVTGGGILVGKFVKKEKTVDIIIIVSAALLLAAITTARISLVYWDLHYVPEPADREYNSWWCLFPDSFCSFASFAMSISLLINRKKSNWSIQGLIYFAIVGAVITFACPAFITKRPFFTVRTQFGLLHHLLLLWISTILIIKNRFRPNPFQWFVQPAIFAVCMLLGVIEIWVIGYKDSMCILKPLISQLEFTKWWGNGIFYIVCNLVSAFSYFGYKCLTMKKEIKTKGKISAKPVSSKLFITNYYKKDKVLVLNYMDNTYQAFDNVNDNEIKAFKKNKKQYIQTLLKKHKQICK